MDTEERFYLTELESGQFRRADEADVKLALEAQERRKELDHMIRKAQEELDLIRARCGPGSTGHRVCFDTAGFPYDVRICVTCGATSLL